MPSCSASTRSSPTRHRGVHFVGRLATYRYYNMDQVVGQALALYAKLAPTHRLHHTAATTGVVGRADRASLTSPTE